MKTFEDKDDPLQQLIGTHGESPGHFLLDFLIPSGMKAPDIRRQHGVGGYPDIEPDSNPLVRTLLSEHLCHGFINHFDLSRVKPHRFFSSP
jgi:hypothetical protein